MKRLLVIFLAFVAGFMTLAVAIGDRRLLDALDKKAPPCAQPAPGDVERVAYLFGCGYTYSSTWKPNHTTAFTFDTGGHRVDCTYQAYGEWQGVRRYKLTLRERSDHSWLIVGIDPVDPVERSPCCVFSQGATDGKPVKSGCDQGP